MTVDLAVIGPMARSVDDLSLALHLIAGPDEVAEGRGYSLSLPPARRDKLAEFRVLFIADHPLLPTSPEVGASLERLAKQLTAAGVEVKRETPLLPDLAASARLYVKLLNAVISARLPDDQYREMQLAIEKIPAEDQSLLAELARGAAMSIANGSGPISLVNASNSNGAPCFATSTSSSVRRPPPPRFDTIRQRPRKRGQ